MTTSRPTIAVLLASVAASAASLMLAVAPALVPAPQTDALRVVELPRVVITAAREPQLVELPRVVVSGRRAETAVAGARSGNLQPVMAPLR